MTPHMLLLTSAEEIGGPLLVPIGNIAYAAPLGQTTRVFLRDRPEYLDVTDDFQSIIEILGGIVMKPHRGAIRFPEEEPSARRAQR
jgi:hypothetical protein